MVPSKKCKLSPISEANAKILIESLILFLSAKHRNGLYAGDFSIDDIYIDKTGRVDILKKFKRIPRTGIINSVLGGSMSHSPPELFSVGGYPAKSLDSWVLTVILFELLTGRDLYSIPSRFDLSFQYFIWAGGLTNNRPNHVGNLFKKKEELFQQIAYLDEQFVSGMSSELKDLFENTLCVDPASRWDIDQILSSQWINADNYWIILYKQCCNMYNYFVLCTS